jgi:hypothetical protein
MTLATIRNRIVVSTWAMSEDSLSEGFENDPASLDEGCIAQDGVTSRVDKWPLVVSHHV